MEPHYIKELRQDFTALISDQAEEKVKHYPKIFPELKSRLSKFALVIFEWVLNGMIDLGDLDDVNRIRTMLRVLDKTPGFDFFDAKFNGIDDPEELRQDFTALISDQAEDKVKQYLEIFPELKSRLSKFALVIFEWEFNGMFDLGDLDDVSRIRKMLRVLDRTPGFDFFDAKFNGIDDPEELRQDFTSFISDQAEDKVKQYLEIFPELKSRLSKFAVGILEWELNGMIELDDLDDVSYIRTMLRVLDRTPGFDFFDAKFNGIDDPEIVWNIIGYPAYTAVVDANENIRFDYSVRCVDNYEVANMFLKAGPRPHSTFITEETFNALYANGNRLFYCCNHDWREVKCVPGLNFPYDKYGFSLIAVEIKSNGEIASVTSRWNFCGGDVGDFLSADELKKILGDKYHELFLFVQSDKNK